MQVTLSKDNVFIPYMARLIKKTKLTETESLFEFKFEDEEVNRYFTYIPGQFVLVSILGIGEAPFCLSSSPTHRGSIELGIRKIPGGDVTTAIHSMEVGDVAGIRGPYGNGFPMEELKGRNLLFVGGGLGMMPLRSVVNYVVDNRDDYGKITFFYGAKCPEERVFVNELENVWPNAPNVEIHQTVDACEDGSWKGTIGVVTCLFGLCQVDKTNTTALICGPPIMYKFVVQELLAIDFDKSDILMTLERKMKCGVGKCAHCQIGDKLTCMDGPIFSLAETERMWEAI